MKLTIKDLLQRQIVIRLSLLQLLSLLLTIYIIWELYWWHTIGLRFIKWHTHFIFTGLLISLILAPPMAFIWILKKTYLRKTLSVSLSIWTTLILTELILMATGWNQTYMEKRSGFYQSPYECNTKNYYLTHPSKEKLFRTSLEFNWSVLSNSLGFVYKEWPLVKDSSKIRVITLGDSFTEGDGAPTDSCYPTLMQNILGENYEILSAGVRGSDPVFGEKNLEDRLLPYKPDIVVQSISENDILFDLCIRGGYERFQPDNKIKFNTPPWWETIYAMSYVSRIFWNALGYNIEQPCDNTYNSTTIIKEVLDHFERVAATNNITVLIVLFPTKYEVYRNTYDYDYSEIKSYIQKLPHVVYTDLFPCYREYIKQSGKKKEDFYWVIDDHHNSTGYHMMAECIAKAVQNTISSSPLDKVYEKTDTTLF